jgi:hypothetical protein
MARQTNSDARRETLLRFGHRASASSGLHERWSLIQPGSRRRLAPRQNPPTLSGARRGSHFTTAALFFGHVAMPTLPAGFIAPCLPTKAETLPSGALWLHEIKHDGFRVIARKDGARVRLYSRPLPADRRDAGASALACSGAVASPPTDQPTGAFLSPNFKYFKKQNKTQRTLDFIAAQFT